VIAGGALLIHGFLISQITTAKELWSYALPSIGIAVTVMLFLLDRRTYNLLLSAFYTAAEIEKTEFKTDGFFSKADKLKCVSHSLIFKVTNAILILCYIAYLIFKTA